MLFIRILRALLYFLPHKGIYVIAWLVAFLAFYLLRFRRSVVMKNLELVYSEKKTREEKTKIAFYSYVYFLLTMLEFFVADRVFKKIKVIVDKSLVPNFDEYKGFYSISIHQGNWELLAARGGALCKKKISIISRVIVSPSVDRWVKFQRARLGYSVIDRVGKRAAQLMVELVKNEEVVGFMVDQRRDHDLAIPFFGTLAYTNTSLVRIARVHPAPIIPIAIHRKTIDSYVIKIYPPIDLEFTENQEADTIRNASSMNQAVEKMILDKPNEHYWFHKRWKGFYHY